jgi:hypothetical protein
MGSWSAMGEWIVYGAIISITHRQREFAVEGITFSSANPSLAGSAASLPNYTSAT